MKISRRLEEIYKKNAEFEKQAPYNFCDRWCERCVHEKQIRCTLYKDELERKITCIAHGRDEDDPEITKAVIEAQFKEVDEKLNEGMNKFGIDLDNPDIDEDDLDEEGIVDFEDSPPDIQKHIQFVENNPLDAAAKNYSDKAHSFLKKTFYKEGKIDPMLKINFEIVSWYHTLLPAKLHRALCGFHEPAAEGDISLYDAVAQFQVCKKAIGESIKALRNIAGKEKELREKITQLLALLHNILSRIKLIEQEI